MNGFNVEKRAKLLRGLIKDRPFCSEISLSTWSVVSSIISIDVLHLLTQHPAALRRADTWRVNGRNATRKPTRGPARWTWRRATSPASRPRPSRKSVKKVRHSLLEFFSIFLKFIWLEDRGFYVFVNAHKDTKDK